MATNQQLARSFAIFAEYDPEGDTAAEHDQMYAGPDPTEVSADHLAELKALGWHVSPGESCFQRWV